MTMVFHISEKMSVTIISCYAPTMKNSEEIKTKFYEELSKTTKSTTIP